VHEAAQILAGRHINGAPVVKDGRVVGIVSESDLVGVATPPAPIDRGPSVFDPLATFVTGRPHPHNGHVPVQEVMSPYVVTVSPNDSIWHAAALMTQHGIKRLPVTHPDGFVVGLVSRADVVRAMARSDESLRRDVIDRISVLGKETIPDLYVRAYDGIVTLRGLADRRTTRDLALRIASRTPGVLQVVDRLRFRHDDLHNPPYPPLVDPKDPRLDWHGEPLLDGRPS
jgi:CBS domain-containing protein